MFFFLNYNLEEKKIYIIPDNTTDVLKKMYSEENKHILKEIIAKTMMIFQKEEKKISPAIHMPFFKNPNINYAPPPKNFLHSLQQKKSQKDDASR